MAHLEVSSPAYVSGCRHLYLVFRVEGSKRVCLGRIYAQSGEYPNHTTLSRRDHSAPFTVYLQAFEQLDTPEDVSAWGETLPYSVCAARLNSSLELTGSKSDNAIITEAAEELDRRSAALTATYARRPAHYSQGAWWAGYVGTPGRETTWQTAKQLPHASVRFGDGAPPYFYADHKSGALVRLIPYWHSFEPGNPYAYLTLRLREVWLSGDPRPVPLHVSRWIESRLSC